MPFHLEYAARRHRRCCVQTLEYHETSTTAAWSSWFLMYEVSLRISYVRLLFLEPKIPMPSTPFRNMAAHTFSIPETSAIFTACLRRATPSWTPFCRDGRHTYRFFYHYCSCSCSLRRIFHKSWRRIILMATWFCVRTIQSHSREKFDGRI